METRASLAREELLDRVSRILGAMLGEALPARDIDEDTSLLGHGIGLDSIEILGLVAALEDEFDLAIDDTELDVQYFATVGGVHPLTLPELLSLPDGNDWWRCC